jgi:hypothetical protein
MRIQPRDSLGHPTKTSAPLSKPETKKPVDCRRVSPERKRVALEVECPTKAV